MQDLKHCDPAALKLTAKHIDSPGLTATCDGVTVNWPAVKEGRLLTAACCTMDFPLLPSAAAFAGAAGAGDETCCGSCMQKHRKIATQDEELGERRNDMLMRNDMQAELLHLLLCRKGC